MPLKYTLLLFPLFFCHFAMAQDAVVDKEIKKIDSLILYNRFDVAQRKTDSLYKQLNRFNKRKKLNEQRLEVRFRQVVLLDRQDGSSAGPLQILLEMKDEAETENLHSLSCRIYLMIALAYEKGDNFELTDKYLNMAYKAYKEHHLENLYSTYCIRRSSYYRYVQKLDSSFYYANQAKAYAEKYHNETDLTDSYILLANFGEESKNYTESLKYAFILLNYRLKYNDRNSIASGYINISGVYLKMQEFSKALSYSDSAYAFYKELPLMYKYRLPATKYKIYEAMGNTDSAHHYFKQSHIDYVHLLTEEERVNIKKIEEKYQNNKKEATIKSKNQQLVFTIIILALVVSASVLLMRKNRKINFQNKIINKQLGELTKTLEQKQVLLSELQHRVKNNLQHVISILEIQKESVDFNNIDELIRGNQNRIHSMALLHKKLNVSENVNDVDLKRYVAELSELVKDSYDNHKKKIQLDIKCEIEKISIEKALPIGLMIVELVSNSVKHAFKKQSIGIINIEIGKDETTHKSKLYYSDNGRGFDFYKTTEKGLGVEIIKGLIDQLDGVTEAQSNNGFELTIYFK